MALLTKANRDKYLRDLGYSGYNKENTLKVQKKYFHDPKEWDGRWGKKTDALVRHLHNVWKYCRNFKPEEFRCTCGKCTGYPTWMRKTELQHVQRIRDTFGRSMVITSGLRCENQNRKVGGMSNSKHLQGKAADFYMAGVTDTFEHRVKAIKTIKELPNHHYTYGDGVDSIGQHVSRPSMGNALHTDVR